MGRLQLGIGCGQPTFGFGIAFRGHRDSVPVGRDSIPNSRDSVPLAMQEALLVKAFPGAV